MNVRAQTLRVASNVFEAATAWCFVTVAAAFALDPHATLVRSPVGQTVHPFDYVWNGFYFVGGVGTFGGLVTGHRRVEVGGLVVLATGLLAAAVAVSALRYDPRVLAYVGFAAASGVRTFLILRGW